MTTRKLPWLLICTVSASALGFVYRRGVDVNWDLRSYHYFSGYSLLHWRFDTDIAPAGLQSFYNPIPCALLYLLLSSLSFPSYAWIIAALQLSSLPILVLICMEIDRELGNEVPSLAAALALCLCLVAPLWWSELGTTFFSSTTSPLVLLGLLFGLRGMNKASRGQPAGTAFASAGCAIGFACGLKLTNSIFAVGLLFALAIVLFPFQARMAARYLFIYVLGLAGGFAPTSWWNVFLFWRWGSPLFPFYNSIFRSPYYDAVNRSDLRFKFHSLREFVNFLFAATIGTHETCEFNFADARMLTFAVLMLLAVAAWILKRLAPGRMLFRNPTTRVTRTFLWFFSVSFAIWAWMFAIQRYLIPIELLFGIAVWILAAYVLKSQHRIVAAMTICLIASLATLNAPDWGHIPSNPDTRNFFGMRVPRDLVSTPADYLVYGTPITYVLPFLHPDSRFFGTGGWNATATPGFNPQVDNLIASAIAADRTRPIRLLTFEDSLTAASSQLAHLGVVPEPVCWHFRSDIDRFVACKVKWRGPER